VPDDSTKSKLGPIPPEALAALTDTSVPKIYMNGFTLGFTNADSELVLLLFGRPIAVLSFSYTLTKTLAEKLTELVNNWEEKTGHKLQTTESIEQAFKSKEAETK